MDCPSCGKKMKVLKSPESKSKVYVCENEDCNNKFVALPQNIFGVS